MKSLNLNAYGVSEMNQQELVETNGGIIPLVIAGITVGKVVGAVLKCGAVIAATAAILEFGKGVICGLSGN